MITILTWLNRIRNPEIKCSGFSSDQDEFKRIHVIIKVAFVWRCLSGKSEKIAGIKAAEFVNDGMVVGLGTGSTAYYFVEGIGRRIKGRRTADYSCNDFQCNDKTGTRVEYPAQVD